MKKSAARLAASLYCRVLHCMVLYCLCIASATGALAAELRIVDATGLVRGIKVVRTNATVVVKFDGTGASLRGECVATNVDGLAPEKRSSISPQGECVFKDVAVGSWQVVVPQGFRWRVRIDE